MKVLQINKFFYKRGGAEAYMLNLSQFLRDQGHEVIEFSMQHPENLDSKYKEYFIKNYEFGKREGVFKDLIKAGHLIYSFEARRKLNKLLQKEKPDIVHLHNFYFHLTPSIISVIKKHNIAMVWTMHDYKLICPNYKLFTQGKICERCKVHKYYNCFKYKCIKNKRSFSFLAMIESYLHNWLLHSYAKIDLYISPSKFLRHKVIEWGVLSRKIEHLYNFVDLEQLKADFNLGKGLIYFGRLSEEKGILTLLAAMKELPEIDLKIVGSGPWQEKVARFIAKNELKNVQMISHTTGHKLHDLIRQSRLVIVPSEWYENNPLTVLEAFALGKPVVGAEVGGIPELVINSQTGFLFKSGDSEALEEQIKANYNKTENIEKMAKNSRKFVENNCAPKAHYEAIINIYQKLLK